MKLGMRAGVLQTQVEFGLKVAATAATLKRTPSVISRELRPCIANMLTCTQIKNMNEASELVCFDLRRLSWNYSSWAQM
jgi:hypothetical protein